MTIKFEIASPVVDLLQDGSSENDNPESTDWKDICMRHTGMNLAITCNSE